MRSTKRINSVAVCGHAPTVDYCGKGNEKNTPPSFKISSSAAHAREYKMADALIDKHHVEYGNLSAFMTCEILTYGCSCVFVTYKMQFAKTAVTAHSTKIA